MQFDRLPINSLQTIFHFLAEEQEENDNLLVCSCLLIADHSRYNFSLRCLFFFVAISAIAPNFEEIYCIGEEPKPVSSEGD